LRETGEGEAKISHAKHAKQFFKKNDSTLEKIENSSF
jgi:hypothetical protein